MARWLPNRSAYKSALWVPILLALVAASAQQSQPPTGQRVEEPVIRAWELRLKGATTIAAVSGVVRITRNEEILKPSVGASIEAGDLVQITPNSSLTVRSAKGVITLTNKEGEWFKFIQ